MSRVAELIEEFCQEHEGYRFYKNYSGRNMFGKTCVGIVTDKNLYVTVAMLCDIISGDECGTAFDSSADALGEICQDELGKDRILYFPSIQADEEPNGEWVKCEDCDYWKDRNDNDYGLCTCGEASECGSRTIAFHRCSL